MDHINPVSKGGTNNLLNLVTSCMDCNRGKSNKVLSDDSVAKKQKKMADELAKRKEQIDMFMEWRSGLLEIDEFSANGIADYFKKMTGYGVGERGIEEIKKWLKSYSVQEIFSGMEESFRTELSHSYLDKKTAFKIFQKTPLICSSIKNPVIGCVRYLEAVAKALKIKYPHEDIEHFSKYYVIDLKHFDEVKVEFRKVRNFNEFDEAMLHLYTARDYEIASSKKGKKR